MGGSFGLDKGAQTRAAQELATAGGDCAAALSTLYEAVRSHAPGYRGMGASAFATALGGWADSGERLPAALSHYARNLVLVDLASATTDTASSQRTIEAASGLNLG